MRSPRRNANRRNQR